VATCPAPAARLKIAYLRPRVIARPDWSRRIPALDGLRGIAILLVLLRHGIFGLESGAPLVRHLLAVGRLSGSGVDLFFVLSGFLIGGILLDARESQNYYRTFYARRAYRILPLYFAASGLFLSRHILASAFPRIVGAVSPLAIPWAAYLTFTQNFFMVHIGWFGPPAMLVTWSLAVEEQFYLVIPFIIRRLRRHLATVLVLIIVLAPLLRLLLRRFLPHGDFADFALMPARADSLAFGVLSAYLVRRPGFWAELRSRRAVLRAVNVIFFCGVAFMTYRDYSPLSFGMTNWGYSWLAAFYASCLLTVVSTQTGVWHGILCNRWLMQLGTLAYCTYLIHFPLIQEGRHVLGLVLPGHPELAYVIGALAAIALTIAIAALSWRFFEKPLLRRGHKYQY
jgi:peptidoglycan/LPS O-acetylase OafA/YrhL